MNEELTPQPELPPPSPTASPEQLRQQRQILIVVSIVAILLIIFVIAGAYFLLTAPPSTTEQIRDVFIIFMALESLVLMCTLVILIIQMSVLINLLQNEIRPILNSTNETVNTLRGTANFLSDNIAEPVIKANEYFAGFYQLLALIGIARSGRTKKNSKR